MTTHRFSRRTMLRGLGVSMALPWLESRPVWGDQPAGIGRFERGARPAGRPLRGQWVSCQGVVGQGVGQGDGAGPGACPPGRVPRENALRPRSLQRAGDLKGNIHSSQTGNLLSGSPLASGGEIRSGHQRRPVPRGDLRPIDQGAQPGARLREVEPVGPQELFDALQLAHLLDLADDPDAARTLSRLGVRPALQG